jgi:pyridoxal biosynthesis lyase PdxS
MALSADDAGQAIIQTKGEAGAGSDASVSVKVALVNGEIQYFTAQVMSYKTNVGNADAITMAEVTLEIDNSVVKVAA